MSKNTKVDSVKHVKQKVGENIYLFNVPVAYAAVHRPVKKYQEPDKQEYKLTAFLTKEQREFLEDEVLVNKSFFEVDVDKNKKRKVKYTSEDYPFAVGLHGVQLTKNAKTKDGKPTVVTVIQNVDGKGVPFEQDLGNGTVATVKLWAYRNQEDFAVVSIDTVVVVDHVPYEGGSGAVEDDTLGIVYERKQVDSSNESEGFSNDVPDDDDVPFDTSDDEDAVY